MRLCVLGSGSKGNSTYIECGQTRILIDGGFSGVETERRLQSIGVDIAELSAILVTHEHGDHIRGVAVLSRKCKLPVYINEPTFNAAQKDLNSLHAVHHFETGCSFPFQDINIHPFSISHDAADPVGFIIEDGRFKIGYCTDTGAISKMMRHRLAGCHGLVLESNHDPVLLKQGPYPPSLQQRVRSKTGHLANDEAARFVRELVHEQLFHVVLAHISDTNNRPEMVREAIRVEMAEAFPGDCQPSISLARQDRAGRLIDLQCGSGEPCR